MKGIIFICLVAVAVAAASPRPNKHLTKPRSPFVHPAFASKNWRPKIVGGQEVTPHSIPNQVALFLDGYFCGGSLISDKWVLTAAHCGELTNNPVVVLGSHEVQNDNEPGRVTVNGRPPIIHSGWDSQNLINDVSVIELPQAVTPNNNIKPVKLADPDIGDLVGQTATASGWGLDHDGASTISPVLRSTQNTILSNKDCEDQFGLGLPIGSGIVCISGKGGHSTCSGDSGGPLTVNQNGETRQVGITSFGISIGCEKGYPAAFTRVTEYRSWIQQTTGV